MIDPVTGWFEITQCDDKRAILITNLVETMWLSRYPRLMETTYDQGSEFIVHEFIKSLIEKGYGITAKPITSGNSTYNSILGRIRPVLGNLDCGILVLKKPMLKKITLGWEFYQQQHS